MNKKYLWIIVAVAVILCAAAFFGGFKYADRGSRNRTFGGANFQQNFDKAGGVQNLKGGKMGVGAGGFSNGEIISKDDKSVTLKLKDGGTKIVFYSDSTKVEKFVSGTAADLTVGANIVITGATNQDGSVTAQTIQLRPEIVASQPAIPEVK